MPLPPPEDYLCHAAPPSALNREELSAVAAHEIGHLVTMKQRTALILTLMTVGVVTLWFVISRLAWRLSDLSAFVVEIAAGVIFLAVAILLLAAVSRRVRNPGGRHGDGAHGRERGGYRRP